MKTFAKLVGWNPNSPRISTSRNTIILKSRGDWSAISATVKKTNFVYLQYFKEWVPPFVEQVGLLYTPLFPCGSVITNHKETVSWSLPETFEASFLKFRQLTWDPCVHALFLDLFLKLLKLLSWSLDSWLEIHAFMLCKRNLRVNLMKRELVHFWVLSSSDASLVTSTFWIFKRRSRI